MPDVRMSFPTAGIDLSRGYGDQQARQIAEKLWGRTTREAVNVRGYETLEERRRGGSRPGLQKVFPQPVVSGWIVQMIGVITIADAASVG